MGLLDRLVEEYHRTETGKQGARVTTIQANNMVVSFDLTYHVIHVPGCCAFFTRNDYLQFQLPYRADFNITDGPLNEIPDQVAAALAKRQNHDPADLLWQKAIQIVANTHPSMAAYLKKCSLIHADATGVSLAVQDNQFIKAVLQREKTQAVLRKACSEVFGGNPEVALYIRATTA